MPDAPAAASPASAVSASQPLEAPEASAKSREEKRFSRADKDKNGKIEADEVLEPRHKAFAKLDLNGNGEAVVRGMGGEDDRQVQGRRKDTAAG